MIQQSTASPEKIPINDVDKGVKKQAMFFRDEVVLRMEKLRADIDALEMLVPRAQWPVPTYADMLFKL